MAQEKQKVIRVLQPNKKPQKPKSKVFIGISALVIGVLVISGLLFAFLNKNPDQIIPQEVNQNINAEDKELLAQNQHKPAAEKSEISKHIDSEEQENKPDEDIHHPQPKLNEITNIFKHKQPTQVAVVEKKPESSNPFDHITSEQKPNATQIVDPNKNPLIKVAPAKSTPVAKASTINTTDAKLQQAAISATSTPAAQKKLETKDSKIEEPGPEASVKIQVTKSVKETSVAKETTTPKEPEIVKEKTQEKE
ncbi:hypothetical protein [Acinetobacter shaoyimingii]|uniref:Uncharacterized protein n=1 Tax=Acinetobacter shaoyimingii TaxID=2715164 RepID=A0A6G8RZJ0_9GAMM|nr:hypothetical protein [Acinetobacter shaoyimingii]NHB59155.1 hypothetical protein [Acinetobacter shaoyimingii]QIO07359.1 hypothetical protein G8E00_16125 [Acinetobacter shaoyimingii]